MNIIVTILYLCIHIHTHARPQLESFDHFFEQFGSGKFSQPAPPSTPQLTSSQSQNGDADIGRVFPTAVPYVHDTRGDGPAARQQQERGSHRRVQVTHVPATLQQQVGGQATPAPADPKSHQAALARNALHRQQLAEVIERHNKKTVEREQEIVRASAEETDDGKVGTSQKSSTNSRISSGRNRPKAVRNFHLEKFLKKETKNKEKDSDEEVLGDIKENVLENLDLILMLAEEIADLDTQAFDVFSKKSLNKRKKIYNLKKTKGLKDKTKKSSEDLLLIDDEFEEK